MRSSIVLVISVLAAFSAGILFERAIGIDVFIVPDSPVTPPTEGRSPVPPGMQSRVAALNALPVPAGSTVFLGDSLIDLEEWHELFPGSKVINRGIAGARISDLPNLFDLRNAKAVFCLIGINDIGSGAPVAQFRDDYTRLLRSIPRGVPFYAIAVPPALRYGSRIIELDLIRQCNAVIRHAMNRRARGAYIDIFTVLLRGKAGLGREAYFAPDGLHFSAEGYHVVADAIRPYLEAESDAEMTVGSSHGIRGLSCN